MNTLITGSLRTVALTLMLLLATTAAPIPDSLGKGSQENDGRSKSPSSYPDLDTIVNSASQLQRKASELKEEMCKNHSLCDNSNEALSENNLKFPGITEGDRCFSSGFNEETCLIKIVSGLLEFGVYLQYMESEMKNDKRFGSLRITTDQLVYSLKLLIKKADAIPTPSPVASKTLLSELQSLKSWSMHIVFRHILWHYTRFIEGTIRAVRFLNPKSFSA